ncbi:relaxase/mobilization nuclease domain-containing protein, partial [Klebsiella pneumoniae]
MNSIAMQNLHVKDAVYHYILSWQEDENPSDDQVFDSVKHSLKRLGMEEHQYVAAIHRDTDNLHVHIAANRVHPVSYRAANVWNDADKLQRTCRELELKHGFKVDNGSWVRDADNNLV